jgi:hypothetical protein
VAKNNINEKDRLEYVKDGAAISAASLSKITGLTKSAEGNLVWDRDVERIVKVGDNITNIFNTNGNL